MEHTTVKVKNIYSRQLVQLSVSVIYWRINTKSALRNWQFLECRLFIDTSNNVY